MAVQSEPELVQEIKRLREELARRDREAAGKERQLERYAADLRETFKQERSRAQELQESYRTTVRALSNAVEARDAYTGKHAERVTAYGVEIASALQVPVAEHAGMEFGFLLHDVGKVAIPDAILYKPDELTEEERTLMAQHPVIGAEIVREIEPFFGDAVAVVRLAPRALGWRRLSGPALWRGESAHRPRVHGRRCPRRAHHRPPVPPGLPAERRRGR